MADSYAMVGVRSGRLGRRFRDVESYSTFGIEAPGQAQNALQEIETVAPNRWRRMRESSQCATMSGGVKIENLLGPCARALVEIVDSQLQQDVNDAHDGGDVPPDHRAVQTCKRLAWRLAPHVALAPRLKWAAFTEDTGGVSLVLQSLVTDRRTNIRIQANGSAIEAIRVDECMKVGTISISLTDPDIGRELAEWVTRRV